MYRNGGSQTAVAAIISALQMNLPVVALDATNAFPTIARQPILHHVQKYPRIYGRMTALLNITLCSITSLRLHTLTGCHLFNVTTGIRIGCVSGPWAYCIATSSITSKFDRMITAVADDIYTFGPTAFETADSIIQEMKSINQVINEHKTKIILPSKYPADG